MDGHSLEYNIVLYEPLYEPQLEDEAKLHNDPSPSPSPSPSPPSLVILCTWTGGATNRRTARYVAGYQRLYPGASVLLIRTELADMTYRTLRTIRARLKPARDVISDHLLLPREHKHEHEHERGTGAAAAPGVLLHFFSHGGCNTAIQLLDSFSSAARAQLREHLRLVVADCCPGDGTLGETYRAGLASLPPEMPLRMLGSAALYGTVSVIYALHGAGMIKSVPGLRVELSDPKVFGTRARRLYLASDGDNIILSKDVIAHVRSAAEARYSTGLVRFERAPHCALVLENPDKYWTAIRDNWTGQTSKEDPPLLAKL
ncbi:unnamed protein product [Discula destructiva]